MQILAGIDLQAPRHDWLVRRAAAFAGRCRARLDLVYVRKSGEDVRQREEALRALMELVPEAVRGEVRVEKGAPEDVLVGLSTSWDAIVCGPREPGALERMFKGTMATRVLRGARCAVLVPRAEREWASPTRLLVGVRLADTRGFVFDEAAKWAKRTGGVLDGLYVDPLAVPDLSSPDLRAQLQRERAGARKPRQQLLEEILATVDAPHRGHVRIEEGAAEDALVDLSPEYDLVIVGTFGRGGLLAAFKASVADVVVRNARCDVLTVPSAFQDDE